MIRKATGLISETFDEKNVKYRITEVGNASLIEAAFGVDAGPEVIVRFISENDGSDVAVRIFNLIHQIPQTRRAAVLEACSRLNAKVRFYKFYLDEQSNLNVDADLPSSCPDEGLGECCFELFARIMSILDKEYHILAEAMYSTPAEEKKEQGELLRILRQLRDKPMPTGREDCS